MKKILLTIILFITMPFIVLAKDNYKVVEHYIASEIEIAGALNVKELLIIEGNLDTFLRKVNYYSFKDQKWDGKTVDLNNGTIYNTSSASVLNVAIFEAPKTIDFNSLEKDATNYLEEFNITAPKDNTYLLEDNKDGTSTIKIFNGQKKYQKTAVFINYSIPNVIVKHNDIKELNYSFKNLNFNTGKTFARVVCPWPTKSDLYNVWIHGNKTGTAQKLVDADGNNLGIYVEFEKIEETFNVRMTMEPTDVSIDLYLSDSKKDALNEIKAIEENKETITETSQKYESIMSYVVIAMGIIYALISILFMNNTNKFMNILYLILGIAIMLFNYLFKFNYWYIYLIITPYIFLKLIKYSKK